MTAAILTPMALVESFSVDPRQLWEGKDGGFIKELSDGRYRVRCKGQHCGVTNRNNRRYPAESTWGKHTREESAFAKRVHARRVTGQLEHPSDGKSSMGLAAVVITEVSAPDPKTGVVMVTFETMSTEPGRVVEAYIRDGVGFGLSSRGNGSVVRAGDGVDEVQGDFEPITFDCVIDESTPGAEVPSRLLKEAHACLDRCRQRLMESAEGDEGKAKLLAEAESFEALQRDEGADAHSVAYTPDHGGDQMFDVSVMGGNTPASAPDSYRGMRSAHNEYLLGLSDGSGHYRAMLNGKNQWDVYLYVHNLEPQRVAADMRSILDAKKAAESHASRMRESYTVDSRMPYSGTMMVLRFDSGTEAQKAKGVLEKAGFNSHLKGDDSLCVYTSYEDPEQAEAHVLRVLGGKKIEPRDESFGVIRRGRIVWEDTMADSALLQEIKAKLDKLTETPKRRRKPKLVERGMRYEDEYSDDYEEMGEEYDYDDDDEEMDEYYGMGEEEGDEYDDLGDDDADDDEDDDEDDEPEEGYYGEDADSMDDDPDVDVEGSPEDELSPDRRAGGKGMTPESAHSFIDVPRKRLGETVGITRIFMDRNENVVGTAQLHEKPQNRAQTQAMFARHFGKKGKGKKAGRAGDDYSKTFRHNYAVDRDLNVTAASKSGSRKLTKAQKKANAAARRKKGKKGGKRSRKESRQNRAADLLKLVEATVTMLTSPYQRDVMAGLRVVNERAADWPLKAQNYVLEALQALHESLEDEGLAAVVEGAARHLLDDPLNEGDDHRFDIDEEGNLDEEQDEIEGDGADDAAYESRMRDMEIENARLQELVAAQNELNQALAVESKVTEVCLRHPILEKVRDKLEACRTADDVAAVAESYLEMVHESRQSQPTRVASDLNEARTGAPATPATPSGTVRIASKPGGSLNNGPLEENIKPSLAGRKPKAPVSTSSRVAKYRRRQRV